MVFLHVRPLILRRQLSLVLLFSKCDYIVAQMGSQFKQSVAVLRLV